jgi:predicted kinase
VEVILLVGLQASGKSTFFRHRFRRTHVHISKDNFRSSRNREKRQQFLLREALEDGLSVVIDNTNLDRESRAAIIHVAREFGARVIGYHFRSSVAESLERNARRSGEDRVPEIAIHSAAKRLEAPHRDEGFDELHSVSIVGEGDFEVAAFTD